MQMICAFCTEIFLNTAVKHATVAPMTNTTLTLQCTITFKGDTTLTCRVSRTIFKNITRHKVRVELLIKINAGNVTRKCGVAFNI